MGHSSGAYQERGGVAGNNKKLQSNYTAIFDSSDSSEKSIDFFEPNEIRTVNSKSCNLHWQGSFKRGVEGTLRAQPQGAFLEILCGGGGFG